MSTLTSTTKFDPRTQAEESRAWFARAKLALAGGVSSSARAVQTADQPFPLYFDHGRAGRITDIDGNEFVDCLLSYGALILGHANPAIIAATTAQLQRGSMFGTVNKPEVELAEAIRCLVPCADLVRFANSGSEALCGAVRAARGFTGNSKLLKFEGHYHGWLDVLAVSNRPELGVAGAADRPNSVPHSPGIPPGVVNDVVICPWNDPAALSAILDAHKGQWAAAIAEPIVANNACLTPQPGFLEFLREQCTRRGIVLIFDEVVTGFRLAAGGAQEHFGVVPDIAVYSKALGGGLPISAFVGKHLVMEAVGANTVKHGGTYSGNPLCAAAALAVVRRLALPEALEAMRRRGSTIIETIRRSTHDHGISCSVQGDGTMFQVSFSRTGTPPTNYRELLAADASQHARFHAELLRRGVLTNSNRMACWFLSVEHTDDDIGEICEAIEGAVASMA